MENEEAVSSVGESPPAVLPAGEPLPTPLQATWPGMSAEEFPHTLIQPTPLLLAFPQMSAAKFQHVEFEPTPLPTVLPIMSAGLGFDIREEAEKWKSREAALRAEFSGVLVKKDDEIKEQATKIEQAEQRLETLSLELEAVESKIKYYDLDISTLKLLNKRLADIVGSATATVLSAVSKARILEQEKIHLEQNYREQFNRYEEVQERYKAGEREVKRAMELADEAGAEAASAQKEKSDLQHVATERLTQIERAEKRAETLEGQRAALASEVERFRAAEEAALLKVKMLKEIVTGKDKEIDLLMQSNNSQRNSTIQVVESLLVSGRAAVSEANNRAEGFFLQLKVAQGKLNELAQELTAFQFGEQRTLESKLSTALHAKPGRTDDNEIGVDSVHDTGISERVTRGRKRSKSTTSCPKLTSPEGSGSVFGDDYQTKSQQTNQEDYTKFTVQKLKQELANHNYDTELLQFKSPKK